MAVELTQDAVLYFLQSRGGSVTNAELLLHFRPFLREHANRDRNRELFKRFVNSVARVKQEDGVSYVVLQQKFRGQVHGVGSGVSRHSTEASVGGSSNVHLSPLRHPDKPRNKSSEPGPTQGPLVLPAAGIILNNNNNNSVEPNLNLPQRKVQPSLVPEPSPAQEALTSLPKSSEAASQALPAPPQGPKGLPKGPARKEAPVTLVEPRGCVPAPVCSARPVPHPHGAPHPSVSPGPTQSVPHQVSVRQVEQDVNTSEPPLLLGQVRSLQTQRVRLRQSYRSAVSVEKDEDEEEECAPGRTAPAPVESTELWGRSAMEMPGRDMFQSTPIVDTGPVQRCSPETSARSLDERHVTDLRASPRVWPQKVSPVQIIPQIHVQDLDPGPRQGSDPESSFSTPPLLTSHNLCQGPSSSVEHSPRGSAWSSCEELSHSGGPGSAGGPKAGAGGGSWQQCAEEHAPGADRGRAWHGTADDLYVDKEEPSNGSTPSLAQLRPWVALRRSSNLRSRMCLSVGADLDQMMEEEDHRALGGSEAARLHRLHLISSSLSLRHMSSSSMSSLSSCSTPPRCHSLGDLTDREPAKQRRSVLSSASQQETHRRQSQVPLEEHEHLWLVKAAEGTWPDIYSLFREEPSLLHRRDFISGFTVLHWIAKHGDHRVLNTLWYGVEKAGMAFDTDAQSSCGYTPLHIAAIHNHKNIIRLLVNKFGASVSLRDAAGKKAWSYLPQGTSSDLFELLGAPVKAALGQTGVGEMCAAPQIRSHSQKRRRRHHFSSASQQRPLTVAGDPKVKRTSSLAAFLKHKPLQKVKAEWAI
ncbi:ankyrin repeat domain-containing protein SOWAHB-like isoform X1 [Periophthalmus magnuspinnatus]|uniref:ankyrin repeat domain-containing protein SOWAHB-like isoform X1 n=1 Tax=Periophthalmus magnuspinnatus TaxID=409849 RepID=UPI00145B1458|nr:ankyrin repeat domain-containing protein SOWAHB-like isoform X1 [Periophthalmus magnuspinnatus]